MKPLSITVDDATTYCGIGRTKLYELKGVHQDGRQPIIIFNAGHANIAGERKPLRMD